VLQDRRSQTETIGFVLVFSLIVLTVGVVLTVGYGGLQDARDAEQVNNAERAFDVFANNIEDITRRGAPSRGTEIRLSDATLRSGAPTYLNITGVNADGSERYSSGNYSLDPVVYRAGDTRIRYAGSAISRIQTDGSILLEEPTFVLDPAHTIIPIVQLSVEDTAVGGSQTVLVRADRRLRRVVIDENDQVDTLQMNVSTPAPDPWEAYLEEEGMACSRTPGSGDRVKLTCTMDDVERVKIVWYEIKVTFQ